MGYGPEDRNVVLKLTYNYGVTEYDKGNGYVQVNSLPFHTIYFTIRSLVTIYTNTVDGKLLVSCTLADFHFFGRLH